MVDSKSEEISLKNMVERPRRAMLRAFQHGLAVTGIRLLMHMIRSSFFFGVILRLLGACRETWC